MQKTQQFYINSTNADTSQLFNGQTNNSIVMVSPVRQNVQSSHIQTGAGYVIQNNDATML